MFLHGWSCSSALWSQQSDLFDRYDSTLIDLPGHGESEVAEVDYTLEYMARAVETVLQQENIEQAVIIGHSMGGPVATMLLRLHSERVPAIIYVDSFFNLPENYVNQQQRKAWAESLLDDTEFRNTLERRFCTDRMTDTAKESMVTVMTSTSKYVRLHSVTTDRLPHAWRYDEVYDIPALLLVTPVYSDIDRQWLHHMPALEVEELKGYGHFLFLEDPVMFNARVKKFLGEKQLLQ